MKSIHRQRPQCGLKVASFFREKVADYIFPAFCLGCQKEGDWLCEHCRGKTVLVKTQVCPECGRISESGRYCSRHRKSRQLAGILAAAYYEEGPIKELIHNLKYNAMTNLVPYLAKPMAEALLDHRDQFCNPLILPVPLYWTRQARRGYNQAALLAGAVAKITKIDYNDIILRKIRQTVQQVKKSGKKRRENLTDCFRVMSSVIPVRRGSGTGIQTIRKHWIPAYAGMTNYLKNRTVILVDDVSTTGTTLDECARVLKAAGAKKVWGLVIARG